ncbi:hypothetical protein AAEU29_10495 [Pseudoalteromonas sp. SSM20]|uniref:hypothetical protein n=1 Tax=Pseudoalteromonas sp. SSM20 TaxID=3139394 RepID=UPI003BAA4F05
MNLRDELHKGIDKSELSAFNLSKIDDLDFDELCDTDTINSSFEQLSPILDFLDDLGVIDGYEMQEKIDSSLQSAFDNFDEKLQANFDKIEEKMDNGEYFGVLKDLASLGVKVLRIKTTMKQLVDDIITDALA